MTRLTDRLAAYRRFSWRSDAAVPRFADEESLILFDGVCVLCSGFARFVAGRDKANKVRFVTAQSRLGQALLGHYNLDRVNLDSNLLIEDGRASAKLEAVAGILRRLGWVWRCAANLVLLPPPGARDWLYDRVARNRYALFGRRETCVMPGAGWQSRILDVDEERAEK